MSSVQGAEKCPHCGGMMVYIFECGTREEYQMCYRCGLEREWKPSFNTDGTVKRNEEGKWLMEYTEAIGYGVVSTWLKAGGGSTYFLKRPLTEEEKAEVIQDLTDDSVDGEQSYAVLYDPVTKEATALFGKIPDDYSNEEG